MSDRGRKRAAVVLLMLASSAAGLGLYLNAAATPSRDEQQRSAEQARTRNQQALASVARRLTGQVAEASQVPQLIAALDSEDAKTVQDLFDDEESWAGVRRSFPMGAVVPTTRCWPAGAPSRTCASCR
jgi:C4-dicarboxylate-specific signal transduction histidine kinase